MLVIRREQMNIFEVAREPFRKWMVEHLKRHFPEQMRERNDLAIVELIREGERRAWKYGIESAPDLCKFIDLMVAFGSDFDMRAEYAWFTDILRDESIGTPTARIDTAARLAAAEPPPPTAGHTRIADRGNGSHQASP